MPVTIHEAFDSRAATVGKNDEATLRYILQGTDDDTVVRTTVDATAPADYKGLGQQDYEMRPLGGTPGKEIWEVEVTYSNGTTQKEPERTQNPPQTGDSSFSFNTGGGTQHISQSLATIASYKAVANPNNPPDNKQAIGVHGDQVDGVDIVVPVLNFAETHYLALGTVTAAYVKTLARLTGTVNDATFKGFDAGEVLFLGASGSQRGDQDWEIAFNFAANENVTGISVGDIAGIDKQGFHYLWVRYVEVEDQNHLTKRPEYVYVEQIYQSRDFSLLGIGV